MRPNPIPEQGRIHERKPFFNAFVIHGLVGLLGVVVGAAIWYAAVLIAPTRLEGGPLGPALPMIMSLTIGAFATVVGWRIIGKAVMVSDDLRQTRRAEGLFLGMLVWPLGIILGIALAAIVHFYAMVPPSGANL
jgi:hypothetical protein